jgi:hypothetical protein
MINECCTGRPTKFKRRLEFPGILQLSILYQLKASSTAIDKRQYPGVPQIKLARDREGDTSPAWLRMLPFAPVCHDEFDGDMATLNTLAQPCNW